MALFASLEGKGRRGLEEEKKKEGASGRNR